MADPALGFLAKHASPGNFFVHLEAFAKVEAWELSRAPGRVPTCRTEASFRRIIDVKLPNEGSHVRFHVL